MMHAKAPTSEFPDGQNYRLTLAYDGREFMGWQRHGKERTVQGVLEAAFEAAVAQRVRVQGSGRTDRGTHAEGQVASVVLARGETLGALRSKLEAELPSDIVLREIVEVDADFHARTSATGKIYRYRIWNADDCPDPERGRVWIVPKALDFEGMRAAAQVLVGKHDFASFATRPNFKQKNTVRDLQRIELRLEAPIIEFVFVADAFLYKMVRNLVRAIVKVGEGRSDASKLRHILEAQDRSVAPGTAPASGLYLDSVDYSEHG
jgi:tRNA pseudouridine38-40 synthase